MTKKLNEGSDVIRESNENLMNNLQEINKEFTGELNMLLKNLDIVIRKFMSENDAP